jgi:hypothetical protein
MEQVPCQFIGDSVKIFPIFYGKPKLHCRVIPIMGHINPFYALRFYFFKINLNIILHSILPSTLIRNP